MNEGFLGFQASLMLDVVICALVLVVPLLIFSIWLVKARRNYRLHKRMQVTLGLLLLLAVSLFEIDMQYHGGWRNIVNKDPASPRLMGPELAFVAQILQVHLIFAISTPFLWAWTLLAAWRRFPHPVRPGRHSSTHKILGWLSTIDLVLTSLTGLIFYYFAFVA